MIKVDTETYSIDTKEDLEKVELLMRRDPLVRNYLKDGKYDLS